MGDIERFLYEDLNEKGDITSDGLLGDEAGKAFIISKECCILAGLEEAKAVFSHLGLTVNLIMKDGEEARANDRVMEIKGKARSILAGERLALNVISRMSGIASITNELVKTCRKKNAKINIAATRKTTPGFRKYEKKAVTIGGGMAHRMGLYDGVIIKDNHLIYLSIREAIRKAKEKIDKPIEVEVESIENAVIAAEEDVNIIMLDNMPPAKGKIAAREARAVNPSVKIEVSGGITPENIANYTFADIISLGWLTHSVKSKDFSLEMEQL
ncbi:MAG: carboxylating nicotinate-nucleotide diphosphorylase [Candidatus Thermoplasmatota archaeon]|nr:carboxylating nicotinate-nucleotide diphosphorylase [Candidatus Thermoplasmatota archaeon]